MKRYAPISHMSYFLWLAFASHLFRCCCCAFGGTLKVRGFFLANHIIFYTYYTTDISHKIFSQNILKNAAFFLKNNKISKWITVHTCIHVPNLVLSVHKYQDTDESPTNPMLILSKVYIYFHSVFSELLYLA